MKSFGVENPQLSKRFMKNGLLGILPFLYSKGMPARPSMKDIAKTAGVSKTAVSLALRNDPQISEAQRSRIQKIARELGYVRNPKIGELMSQMRSAGDSSRLGTLALINCNQDIDAFLNHPTIPNYVRGCKHRATELGYATDTFWLHQPNLSAQRWITILRSRGISGLVLIGMMRQNRIPEFFKPVIDAFPATVTGVRTRRPALSFSCADHHMLTLQAFERTIACGYMRPALVLEKAIDELVEHRFTSAFATGQRLHLPLESRIPHFLDFDRAKSDPTLFFQWMKEFKPDAILTLYSVVEKWVLDLGLKVPDQIGLVQLEWRSQKPHWAGMDQHNNVCGEAAVDMLINMIYNGERGFPSFPRATLIGATWVEGSTVRDSSS
jgi:LacI family transcriptional regulator